KDDSREMIDEPKETLEKSQEVDIGSLVRQVPEQSKKSARNTIPIIEKALKEEGIYSDEVLAYALATLQHETSNAFEPVNEGWYNDEKYGYESGFTGRSEARKRKYQGGEEYFGRGFIQLTHKDNYRQIGKMIGE